MSAKEDLLRELQQTREIIGDHPTTHACTVHDPGHNERFIQLRYTGEIASIELKQLINQPRARVITIDAERTVDITCNVAATHNGYASE